MANLFHRICGNSLTAFCRPYWEPGFIQPRPSESEGIYAIQRPRFYDGGAFPRSEKLFPEKHRAYRAFSNSTRLRFFQIHSVDSAPEPLWTCKSGVSDGVLSLLEHSPRLCQFFERDRPQRLTT